MYCRGEKTRAQIVKEYELTPIAHIKLLAGQEKMSCTGVRLTDSGYYFSCKKRGFNKKENFLCGSHAAKHFLSLIGSHPISLFDPLKYEAVSIGDISAIGKKKQKHWNKKARQLDDAIHLLLVCWNSPPGDVLVNIKETIGKYYYKEPYLREVKAINTVISKDREGRTLKEMVDELRRNNNIKEYTFGELNDQLESNGIKSYFG